MSIIDSKNFVGGGMDTDSAPELIAPNDYVSAYNVRNTGNSEKEEGYVVAIESNDIIPITLPAGLNKCIGSERFEGVRKIYKFIYNSQLKHCITEIDYDTNTETIIYTNLDDSGGEDALILNPDVYVIDIKLLENLLIFRNSANEPCLINIARLKSGGYGVVTKDDFLLIRQQPYVSPSAELTSDINFSANFLRGKLFQFRYRFGYDDNENSVWSLMSDRPVPEKEQNPNIGTISTVNNAIVVGVNIGSNRVTNINIAVRQGDYDWSIVKEVTREYVLTLIDIPLNVEGGVYESYDSVTNTYYFTFYNNGLYQSIDVLETDLLYDYIPKECDALELINGRGDVDANSSVLTLGSTTEGYERPNTAIQLSVSGVDSGIEYVDFTSTDPLVFNRDTTFAYKGADPTNFLGIKKRTNQSRYCFVGLKGTPRVNDKITIYVTESNGVNIVVVGEHIVESGDIGATLNDTMFNIAGKLGESIAANAGGYLYGVTAHRAGTVYRRVPSLGGPKSFYVPEGQCVISFITSDYDDGRWWTSNIKSHTISLASAGTGNVSSIPSLKSNSSYQVALAYYDRWGRPFPIMTNQSMSLATNSYAEYKGYVPYIKWAIDGPPPENAHSYQWLSSKNTTHLNTVYVDGYFKPQSYNLAYIEINLNSLNKYQENNPNTTVVYDFSKGDRVTFCSYLIEEDGVLKPIWFNGEEKSRVDLEILDYQPVITEPTPGVKVTNYVLKIQKPSNIALLDLENKTILMELYTPLNSAEQLDNVIFYETGERYPIVDGAHSVTSGNISGIDCYFKTREYNIPDPYGSFNLDGNKTFLVEDFNFSDFYASRYTSLGRPRTFFDTPENLKFPARIRYSFEFVSKSKINLINRFYGENLVTYDLKYGAIRKLFQRDNTLICIQETKVGFIPVSISIIEDQASKNNVATSTLLLNKIRYNDSGNIGIGSAVESFAEYSGDIYFVDPNRSEPIRINYNGVNSIAGKMSKFFRTTLKDAIENGVKLIGYYNVFNREYILTTEQESGVIVEINFNATSWDFLEDFVVDPDTITITDAPEKGNVTVNTTTGIATYTPDIGESGNDSFTFSFIPVGEASPVSKNVCIDISEGDTDIPFFALGEVVNQQLSVYSDQSIAAGPFENTAPVPISITSPGQYKINDGSWTSSSGNYYPGDTVVVRVLTSSSVLTTTSTTLTIGTESAVFSATTASYEEIGYFVIDIYGVNDLDNIGAYIVSGGGGIVSNSPVIYPGNNLYPSVVDPDDSLIVMSDFYEFNISTSGYRMIFNIEKYKATYPSATSVYYTIVGLQNGGSGTIQSNYSSRSSAGTIIEVSPAPDYMISLVGGAVITPVTSIFAPMAGAPGPLPKPPTDATSVYLYVYYDLVTNELTVSYPV